MSQFDRDDSGDARDPLRKTGTIYARGVFKRWWLVLFVAGVLGGGGTWGLLQIKPLYWASARIVIEPPQAVLQGMKEDHAGNNAALFVNFFNTRLNMITTRQIAERVMKSLHLSDWQDLNGVEDPVSLLQGWLKVKQVKNSNMVDIGLEGSDPALVARIVNSTVDEFLRYEQESMQQINQVARGRIETELRGLEALLAKTRDSLAEFHRRNEGFLTNGESVESARLTVVTQAREQADLATQRARRELERFQGLQAAGVPFITPTNLQRLNEIRDRIRQVDEQIAYEKQIVRPEFFETDPAIRALREKRVELENSLKGGGGDDAQFELERLKQEVKFAEADQQRLEQLAAQQRQAVLAQQSDQNKVNGLNNEFERLKVLNDDIARKRLELEIHQGLVAPNIRPIDLADEPRSPYWPILPIMIPAVIVLGLGFGVGLAVLMEMLDETIRRPEHAAAVTGWPMLAVVPRFRTKELKRRGRPRPVTERPDLRDQRAWELFRRFRSSVLGRESGLPDGDSLRSIVVTSAAAGEGKTTVAVNLAATCARAGESVLLVDADLRRSCVERYFPPANGGLADVLQGRATWVEALTETDVPNLTVLPAGSGDAVTADILGTVEMHDLLSEWSDRFDRIIIDVPPLLGLADARITARFADGMIAVVRADQHGPKTLRRMKEIADGEGLRPVGIVFNGLRSRHLEVAVQHAPVRVGRGTRRARERAMAA